MCAREFSTSSYFSKWIFSDFIFQIIFSSSYLTKKETADASSVSGGCCTESLNCPSRPALVMDNSRILNYKWKKPTATNTIGTIKPLSLSTLILGAHTYFFRSRRTLWVNMPLHTLWWSNISQLLIRSTWTNSRIFFKPCRIKNSCNSNVSWELFKRRKNWSNKVFLQNIFFFLKTCNFFNFWYFWLKICASKIFLTKIDVRMWVTHNVPRGLNEQAF